jgi:RNA polymerase sigma factor (TIGR02999 family)
MADPSHITELLKAWEAGDPSALDRLTPVVYEELRRLAHAYMRREGAGHSLQTTALVHEAYLRLAKIEGAAWKDRAHFFAVCARIMRRILVDDARKRLSEKRGGHAERQAEGVMDVLPALDPHRAQELCAIDDALTSLAEIDARRAKVIELRFFGGLSVDETAEALRVSPQTVMRDWKLARAWLTRELRRG